MTSSNFTRRRLLGGLLGAGALGAAGVGLRPGVARSRLRAGDDPGLADRKLLFVVCAAGGGNIVDSFLPVLDSEVSEGDPTALSTYPESLIVQPQGSNIRCVGTLSDYSFYTSAFSMQTLLQNHYADMVVLAHECTSVNHAVAQKRSITGAGVNFGRTIMEANAERHGSSLLLPNTNMASGGYIAPGDDPELPRFARAELIADPIMFAASTHGRRGVAGAPAPELVERARGVRSKLESASPFGQTFIDSSLRATYLEQRETSQPAIEAADLISKLMLVPQANLPAQYGLDASPLVGPITEAFPLLYQDAWEARAALAFAPGIRTRVVEIDADVISVARSHFQLPDDDERLQVIHGDGARYLRDHRGGADALLLDVFDGLGTPQDLYSQEFFDDCRAALAGGGPALVHLWSFDVQFNLFVERIGRSFSGRVLKMPVREGDSTIIVGLPAEAGELSWTTLAERAALLETAYGIEFGAIVEDLKAANPAPEGAASDRVPLPGASAARPAT